MSARPVMERFKGVGLKLTPQRLAILDYLEGNKNHPSAEDIYTEVSKRFPTMSLATVYNTLEVLKRKGEVRELTIDAEKKRFDADAGLHHHLICTVCRRVVDVHADFNLSVPVGERRDFEITGSHVEFYGLCPECRRESGNRRMRQLKDRPITRDTGRKHDE